MRKMPKTAGKIKKRLITCGMTLIMAALGPFQILDANHVSATGTETKYVKEFKVFSKKNGDIDDARKWCASQKENKDSDKTNDWDVVPGDLNEGAEGGFKSAYGVFLVYQTTTDVKEAVTDVALMNEGGNYSESEYEIILKEQRETFADMVSDMGDMLKEYRENVKNELPTAITVRDYLNTYIEDDSNTALGDLLLTISDEDLTELLLQANGNVVLLIQEQLSYACDTNGTTWLDRMSKIGTKKNPDYKKDGDEEEFLDGYTSLYKMAYKAYNNNSKKAVKYLDQRYKSNAQLILDNWDDLHQHFDNAKRYEEEYGLDDMSDEEIDEWFEEIKESGTVDNDTSTYLNEISILSSLAGYKYENGSLYDFFSQTEEDIHKKGLKCLYPVAASLTEGQFAGINETVSVYTLVMNAISATGFNGYDKGMATKLDEEEVEEAQEQAKENAEIVEESSKEKISVYDGVDREIFKGGVAVTSEADNISKLKNRNWATAFVESRALEGTTIGLLGGSTLLMGGALACSSIVQKASIRVMRWTYDVLRVTPDAFAVSEFTTKMINMPFDSIMNARSELLKRGDLTAKEVGRYMEVVKHVRGELFDKGMDTNWSATIKVRFYSALQIGLAVAAIILCVADIVMTAIALHKYYNVEHLPIPHHIVDRTYEENKDTSFISYKSVLDVDGDYGDLNAGQGKQWLAIYATKDTDAGEPILAPDGKMNNFVVQKKSDKAPSNYSPLHMFTTPNAAQNLTYADGSNGWSYNDDEGGIYLFFMRDYTAYSSITEDDEVGTVMTERNDLLVAGILGATTGLIIGVLASVFYRKRQFVEFDDMEEE